MKKLLLSLALATVAAVGYSQDTNILTNITALDGINWSATNWVAIPYGGYQIETHDWIGGVCLMNKVSDNFWGGVRIQDNFKSGESTTAGVQGQLQVTTKILGITVTPGLETSVGIGRSALYGSAGPFILVNFHTWAGKTKSLSIGGIVNYEHFVNGSVNGNQLNIGLPIVYSF
jgi:hypothetical protein